MYLDNIMKKLINAHCSFNNINKDYSAYIVFI